MIVNLLEVLKDYEGKECSEQIEEKVDQEGQSILRVSRIPLTFKSVFKQAINKNLPTEERTVEDLVMSDGLNVKIYSNDEIEITASDAEFLLDRVVKIWNSPTIYKCVRDLFRPSN